MKRRLAWILATALVLGAAAAFVAEPGVTSPEPVAFEDTVSMGVSDADLRAAQHEGYRIPRAQVFYSQFGFVVGFNGMDSFTRAIQRGRYEHIWGTPIHAYVSDFSTAGAEPVEGGSLEVEEAPGWVDAEEALYVTGGDATVPFSSRDDAQEYADSHGGEVVSFEVLLDRHVETPDVYDSARSVVDERSAEADSRLDSAADLLEREVSVTVEAGGEASTTSIQQAVDAAPDDTAVKVGAGVYEGNLTLDEPVTVLGEEGARVVGEGEGSVVTVESDEVAVSGLEISGVGEDLRSTQPEGEDWDRSIEEAYGGSDAAVEVRSADDVLVDEVEIETPSTGVLLVDSDGSVVRDTAVRGSESWGDGFMDVLAMRSPAVVDNVSLYGGRDSVYSHGSDGLVVRDSYMEGGRFGVHLMYSSDVLVRDNEVRDSEVAGLVVMTRPTGIYVVGNDVRRSSSALITVGRRSYFADNVLVDNEYGLKMGARDSVYAGNVVADNDVGARASTVIPSNEVTRNDFVDNDVQVVASEGSMRIWGYDSPGNYWSDAPEDVDRYRPTDPVDSSVTTVDGAVTFRRSPTYSGMRALETSVPGTWRSGVVDEDPLAEPVAYEDRRYGDD